MVFFFIVHVHYALSHSSLRVSILIFFLNIIFFYFQLHFFMVMLAPISFNLLNKYNFKKHMTKIENTNQEGKYTLVWKCSLCSTNFPLNLFCNLFSFWNFSFYIYYLISLFEMWEMNFTKKKIQFCYQPISFNKRNSIMMFFYLYFPKKIDRGLWSFLNWGWFFFLTDFLTI